jgi:LemA protein
MAAFGIMLTLLVIVIIFVIIIYNKIISRMNAVERAWADTIAQERQKNKIIPAVEKAVEQYVQHENTLLRHITELRSSLQKLSADNVDLTRLADAETKTLGLLNRLYAVAENYPDLKASELYNNLMREIAEQQENIAAAIRIFNQNVEDFNNTIEMFPNSLVNGYFNKKQKMNTFSDSAAESGFEYRPNFK